MGPLASGCNRRKPQGSRRRETKKRQLSSSKNHGCKSPKGVITRLSAEQSLIFVQILDVNQIESSRHCARLLKVLGEFCVANRIACFGKSKYTNKMAHCGSWSRPASTELLHMKTCSLLAVSVRLPKLCSELQSADIYFAQRREPRLGPEV